VSRAGPLTSALLALACLAPGCAPSAQRGDAHLAVVSASRRTFRVPAPAGMVSDLGHDAVADSIFRAAVPSDFVMLAHFSTVDASQRGRQAAFEIPRSLPADDATSLALFAEMRKFLPLRYERTRATSRPPIRALALSLREGASDPAAADVTVLPGEQVPIRITRSDERVITAFALVGMPDAPDESTGPRAVLVGTTVALLKHRLTYLYVVERLPEQGDPLASARPALEAWTEKVLAANR
jgi:hypothetical protein